ncbi:hypothetical protein GSI_09151 [Ganoderma sinense ZZ0214-1]|uniref:Uncharacterized protein n=1 Tax=Ganoderma sinense ZZ0214-1 TaxID=1077348 RepID=A0A2G8S5R2_9APHY|nr:hypothetical protein GSI_09151 [Ganoderma sinense ZZ0214-1]
MTRIDPVHRMTRADPAHHTIRIDLVHRTIPTDLAHHMVLPDHGMGNTTVHPVQVVIHMRRNGDTVRVLCRPVNVVGTTTTNIGHVRDVTLPNIMSIIHVTARREVARGILKKVSDLTRGTRERVADPTVPVLLNLGRGIAMVLVIDPVPEAQNTTRKIVMAGLVVPAAPLSMRKGITIARVPATPAILVVREDEPEHGVVHISPPSEPEYEHTFTPSPQSHPRYPHVAPPATESLRKTLVASPERRGTVPVLPSRTRSPIARSSPIGHATVPVPVDQNDAGLTDAEQERQNRFDELAGALDRTIIDVQDGEEKREENYRANEEERQRIFVENERRREIEVEERLEAMWKKVEDRLAALPSAVAMPAGSESTSTPPGGRSFEDNSIPDAFEPSAGPPDAPTPARHRVDGAASRHAADIREAILLGKEAAQAERERALELNEAARNRMQEEHKAHIRALEDELSAVRRELAEEKMARAAEEAGRHERKRAEMVAQTDLMRGQVGDLIGVLLDRRDVKAIRRHDSSDNDGKTWGGLTVIGPRCHSPLYELATFTTIRIRAKLVMEDGPGVRVRHASEAPAELDAEVM